MNYARNLRTPFILAGLVLASSWATSATAAPKKLSPVMFQQANGQNAGPQETDGGPGHEQSTVTWVKVGDVVYVVNIYMSSKVDDGNWQCKCSSIALKPDGAPEVVADQVQLTHNGGDRPCNHPKAASNGTTVVWMYGTNEANGNTRTYATAVDHMCNTVAERTRISINNNNNDGAPEIAYNSDNNFTGGYLSTGNNDTSIAVGIRLNDLGGGQYSIEKTWLTNVVTPSNIGRPTIVAEDAGHSLFCASKGNNRPPEDGVQCAQLDALTGQIAFKQIIAASQPDQHIYMNQPTLVALENNTYALRVLESSGEGKTNNKKGQNIAHDYVISPLADSFTVAAHEVGLGSYPTHSTICSGRYGLEGKVHFAAYGTAVTGNGVPLAKFYRYGTSIEPDTQHNTWSVGWYGDSGKLANLYGHNPHTQGRDFLRCIGDVPNPGFGMPNGLYPSVKSFFVMPHAGRIPGEEKNSQWLALVPGEVTEVTEPAPPADVDDVQLGPQGEEPTPSEPPPATDPGDDEKPGDASGQEPTVINPRTGSGCAASPGDAPLPAAPLAVIALGLGLAVGARRRKGG